MRSPSARMRASDDLDPYFANMMDHPKLTRAEEVELFAAMREHEAEAARLEESDPEASAKAIAESLVIRHRIAEANLGLVAAIAKRFRDRGLSLGDLIGEGHLGLLQAIDLFDHTRGFKFSTYATYRIRMTVRAGVMNLGLQIRLPGNMAATLLRWRTAEETLHGTLSREPTFDEIADSLRMKPKARIGVGAGQVALRTRCAGGDDRWYDDPLEEADRWRTSANRGAITSTWPTLSEIPDRDSEEDDEEATVDLAELSHRLDTLDPRDRLVIEHRFGLGGGEAETLTAIGKRLGLTKERVRQLEQRALCQLGGRRHSRWGAARKRAKSA